MDVDTGKGLKKGRSRPEMNVTPLVDVVLVLLIIFMVVTPLLSKQFWLNLPKKDDSVKAEVTPPDIEKNVVLSVDKNGVVRLNKDEVPKADVERQVRRALAAKEHKVIYFDAANDAPYASAVEVMDLARRGGAATIAILTESVVR
jgi:biopolymer transport protein TolR